MITTRRDTRIMWAVWCQGLILFFYIRFRVVFKVPSRWGPHRGPLFSSSFLVVLACSRHCRGGLGNAHAVSRRGVPFPHLCKNLLRFWPDALDGTALISLQHSFQRGANLNSRQSAICFFSLLTPESVVMPWSPIRRVYKKACKTRSTGCGTIPSLNWGLGWDL